MSGDTDKLAQIEALATVRLDPDGGHPRWLQEESRDVLALVEIAKAARDIESRIVSGPEWDVGEVFNSAGRLRAALSALDGDT